MKYRIIYPPMPEQIYEVEAEDEYEAEVEAEDCYFDDLPAPKIVLVD